jgi:hypothetical protein
MSTSDDLDALADLLRRLPPPPVPAGLEAKLLAAIPPEPVPRPRRWVWVGGGLLAATAVLLAALLAVSGKPPDRSPSPGKAPPAAFDAPGRADADPAAVSPSFDWPVVMTVPTRRPSDALFN